MDKRGLRRAGTVHVVGPWRSSSPPRLQINQGRMPERPMMLVGQQYLADPTRSTGDVHPVWAYAHVPSGYDGDATEVILDQIERFAPGLRERIVARSRATGRVPGLQRELRGRRHHHRRQHHESDRVRPRFGLTPYDTGIDGVYICSAATPPGAGVHGMNGFNAAQRAISRLS